MHDQHWLFAAVCVVIGLFLVRLALSERVTLQGSLSFLVLLGLGAGMALFPQGIAWLAMHLGFELASNFFFAASLFALMVLHVNSLIMNSRVALRSVALTQELAILQERIDRLQAQLEQEKK
jgi:Uncharacterized conserved protein (DUF2304)